MNHLALSDYALIGNSRAAALASRHGSIDWCCLPEFDSPAIFAALLDPVKGGRFSVTPSENYESHQEYVDGTNVVSTHFRTSGGEVRLFDAFIAMSEAKKAQALFPDHEILRVLEGVSGTVKFKLEFSPRPFYGKYAPELNDRKRMGIHVSWKEHIYVFTSTLHPDKIRIEGNGKTAAAEFEVRQGERILFSFSYSAQSPAIIPELNQTALRRLETTIAFWRAWIAQCSYDGPYREHVKRSALVLKLLAYAPSGAIIAAPTTSLPEKIGKDMNWDYRYCWLRDASFTTRVLIRLGFEEEAHAYMEWILHATRLTRPKLQVVYSVFGHARLKEIILDWMPGYRNSRPVRIGNMADRQFQLDVYGEVLDAIATYAPLTKNFDRNARQFITGLGEVICRLWHEPDNGIWEIRSSPLHHTHSKAMACIGLGRLIDMCENFEWQKIPLEKFKKTARQIRGRIEEFGYNNELKSYTREFGGSDVDASLLTLSLTGYCDPASPRMRSTLEVIQSQLSKNNMIYRYRNPSDDGGNADEGSFGVCTYWLAENLAKLGEVEKARDIFEAMLQCASPCGLLSEEIDPDTHELLGNYPQGFTHIGLINAAISIGEALEKTKAPSI
ncbi:MAG TPA: glycoside hydrolase family 15 protein [Chryseosolibacter sp.]